MKQSFLAVLLLFSFLTAQAQEEPKTHDILNKKHEIRLGVIKLLAAGIFEGSYEYITDSNQGFGAYILANFNTKNNVDDEWFENYSLTPYYRMYFQTNEDYGAKGFFVEGFTSFFSSDYNFDNNSQNLNNKDVFDVSIGISLGKKWINSSGFVFEFKLGAGRNILGNANFDALVKGDLYVGYRF